MQSPSGPWATPRLYHDFAETLHVARGSVDLIAKRHERDMTAECKKLVEIARDSIRAAEQLLQAARPSSSRAPAIERVSIDASLLLGEVVAIVQAGYPNAIIEPGPLPVVRASEAHLRRVLLNLVANAAKHGGSTPRVRIEASPDPEGIRISISDDGPGIDTREQLAIFRHAPRADGHGQGLPNALDLVHEMGGRMWIDTSPKQGTTIHFTIPNG